MRAMEVVVLFGVIVTLLAWLLSRFVRRRPGDAIGEGPIRPNVLFWFIGCVTVLVGVIMLIAGALAVANLENPFHGTGPQKAADAASLVTWGAAVLVNGVYVWRGARWRGLRDRLGRLLIIVGYGILGVALNKCIHSAVKLWTTTSEQASNDVLTRTMLTFLVWGAPAALLVWLGTKLALEKVLMTVEVNAHYE